MRKLAIPEDLYERRTPTVPRTPRGGAHLYAMPGWGPGGSTLYEWYRPEDLAHLPGRAIPVAKPERYVSPTGARLYAMPGWGERGSTLYEWYTPEELERMPGRAITLAEEPAYQPPSGPPPLGPPAGQTERQVTINIGGEGAVTPQPQAIAPTWSPPTWGGGGGQPAPAPMPMPMPQPSFDWGALFRPMWEPMEWTREIYIRPQDWRAIPKEVRSELEKWLRKWGWRPGGTWGRYGAIRWVRATPTKPYWGEEAFASLPERHKAWLYWLFSQKGWATPGAERPQTTGWSW